MAEAFTLSVAIVGASFIVAGAIDQLKTGVINSMSALTDAIAKNQKLLQDQSAKIAEQAATIKTLTEENAGLKADATDALTAVTQLATDDAAAQAALDANTPAQ